MNRVLKISIGIFTIIGGWLCLGVGFAEPIKRNTEVFLIGFILIPIGILIISKSKKK